VKILLYGLNFWPEPTGIGKYSGEMASWLAAQGHQVRVITAPPYYPAWKVSEGYRWPPFRKERWAGVRLWRAPLWVPREPGGKARVLHLVSFAAFSLPLMLIQILWRPDVVFTVAPTLTCAPGAWFVARLSGARAWLHLQDFEVDAAFQMGMLQGARFKRAVLAIEWLLLRRFDIVSTISRRMVRRLQLKGVDPARIRFFPNWVDTEAIRPLTQASPYRAEWRIGPETIVVLFSGTLGSKQGLMVMPEAARLLRHRQDILFVVCGDGPVKNSMLAASDGALNFLMFPLQPTARLGDLLGLADIHLLPQSPVAEDLVLPSKLSGMLASGRAIVATCRLETEIAEIVSQCGEVVAPEDAAAVAAAIERLSDDPARRRQLGQRARMIAEQTLGCDAVLSGIAAQMWAGGNATAPAKVPSQTN